MAGLYLAYLLASPSVSSAADGTWTNTSGGAWTNTNNWSGFVVPSGTDSVANFASVNIAANSTVTNSTAGTLIGTFLFGDTSGTQTWGVTGGSFNLSTSSGTPTISNSVTTTFSSTLGGSQGMLKDGSAVLILGGANSYTGNTILSAGTLRLGTSDVLPDGSVVVFANNANNKELTVFSATDTIGGLSSSGGAGTILVQNNRALNTGTLNLNVAAATSLTYDGIIRDAAAGVAVNNLNITKSGAGTQVFSGGANVSYSGATTIAEGVLEFSGATINNNTAINVTGSNAAIRFNVSSGNLVRTNTIAGVGSLVKAGTNSALTLSNDNTYTGSTVLEAGFIRLGASDRIADASVLRFATTNDARFQMQGFSETLGGLDSGGSTGTQVVEGATNAAATLTLAVGSGSSTYNGFLRDSVSGTNANNLALVKNGAGTQVLSGGNTRVAYSGTTTINAGTLEFAGGTVNNNSAITLAGGTVNFSGGGTRSNTISGSGNLEKTGANTLTLSGNNTYTGTTTVSAGSLIVNGNQSAATGVLNVSASATLGGSGTIGAATTISGIHSPGNSAGVQTFADGLTYATASTFEWELFGNTASGRGTSFDGVDVTGGTLAIQAGVTSSLIFNASGSIVLWSDGFWDSNQSWLVFENANAPSILGVPSITIGFDSLGNDFAVARAGSSFEWDQVGNDIYLNYVIPEPSTYALLVLAAAGLGAHVARRRRYR